MLRPLSVVMKNAYVQRHSTKNKIGKSFLRATLTMKRRKKKNLKKNLGMALVSGWMMGKEGRYLNAWHVGKHLRVKRAG